MKKTLITIYFSLFVLLVSAQDSVLISGQVHDIESGFPVIFQEIIFKNQDQILLASTMTDEMGSFSKAINLSGTNTDQINVFTFDCNMNRQDTTLTNLNENIFIQFDICTNNYPYSCFADFSEIPYQWDQYKIQFIDQSYNIYGNQFSWFWDFGDGSTSSEQNPIYTFSNDDTYNVCLTIEDSTTNCFDTFCKSITIPYQIPQCQAVYYVYPDSTPLQVQFMDASLGYQLSWYWEFGDGSTSTEQNPTHLYPEPGIFQVCLTINDTVNNCTDTFCDSIVVKDYSSCMALFAYETDSLEQSKVYFQDLSIGNITEWFWDFGDGHFSTLQNPEHTYTEAGEYFICLTVMNNDSLNYCFDLHCEPVTIQNTGIECIADFNIAIDSTSTEKYLYYFTDQSTGEIDNWFWDFGDGTSSFQQNPTHRFATTGQYDVCLTVSSNEMPDTCFDFICKLIITPKYYDLGGLAFAGEYPLNNPEPTGDTAHAYLYMVRDDDKLLPVDTMQLHQQYGNYWFFDILEGDYVIEIQLTENSQRFSDFFPTYYQNQLIWTEANRIHLFDSSQYKANIYLKTTFPVSYGIGSISGNVSWGIATMAFNNRNDFNNINILLYNQENQAMYFTKTDEDGNFSFQNINYGTYKIIAESAGLYTIPVIVTINETEPSIYRQLYLFKNNVLGNEEIESPERFEIKKIFPNPAKEFFIIEIETSITDADFSIEILDITGRSLSIENIHLHNGTLQKEIPLTHIKKGIYLVKIMEMNSKSVMTRKIIKME